MRSIKLKDLGFIRDDIQNNHWNNDNYLLYESMTGEYVLAEFDKNGEIQIIQTEETFDLMKTYLAKGEFRSIYREKRLSEILDKDQSDKGVWGFSLN